MKPIDPNILDAMSKARGLRASLYYAVENAKRKNDDNLAILQSRYAEANTLKIRVEILIDQIVSDMTLTE